MNRFSRVAQVAPAGTGRIPVKENPSTGGSEVNLRLSILGSHG